MTATKKLVPKMLMINPDDWELLEKMAAKNGHRTAQELIRCILHIETAHYEHREKEKLKTQK